MKPNNIVKLTMAAVISVGLVMASSSALAGKNHKKMEKCYGVAKAGMNDCAGSSSHSCAGQSTMDDDSSDWIYVPKGTCKRISGGMLKNGNGKNS